MRVLDLTRVLAGPSCARSLAEHGADVLRVTREDLADLGPPSDVDTGIGKLQTHIDLRDSAQAEIMRSLVRDFNVYRWAGRMLLDAARVRQREKLATRIGKES